MYNLRKKQSPYTESRDFNIKKSVHPSKIPTNIAILLKGLDTFDRFSVIFSRKNCR